MQRSTLQLGLAATFGGLSVLLAVLAFVYSLFFLLIAALFGLFAYLVWYQASGRMARRIRRRAAREARSDAHSRGGFGAGPREQRFRSPGPGSGADPSGRARQSRTRGAAVPDGPTLREAYRILDLSPGADDEQIQAAYREKVKAVHPDTENGSEEEFKRVTRAYETLTGDA